MFRDVGPKSELCLLSFAQCPKHKTFLNQILLQQSTIEIYNPLSNILKLSNSMLSSWYPNL